MLRAALMLSAVFVGLGVVLLSTTNRSSGPAVEAQAQPEAVLEFPGKPPVVSFAVHLPGPDGKLTLPAPPELGDYREYADGSSEQLIGGKRHAHVSDIARNAGVINSNDLNLDNAIQRTLRLPDYSLTALSWLKDHAVPLSADAITWHYGFDYAFNNITLAPGWPSAFGQADVIKALLLAARRSGDRSYLTLASRAAYAYHIPCERGGLRCRIGNAPWFAEIPVPDGQAPMILNGHLYSVLMLHRLWQATGDPRVRRAYAEGLASARAMLLRYDTGYWTAYALSPRLSDLTLYIGPGGADTELREVTATSAFTNPSFIRISVTPSATFPGNGVGGLTTGTPTGATADGVATVYLLPGRPTDLRNLAMSAGFDVTVRYAAPDCDRLWIATTDWRASEFARQVIIPSAARREGAECVASAHLPNSLVQWSTVVPFYHDWHTRLVDALWRATGDPLFYATAVRWYRYSDEYKRLEAAQATGVQRPVFDPQDNLADDAALLEALGGAEPASLSDVVIRSAIRLWVLGHGESPGRERALLARAGLRAEAAMP